MDAYNLLASLDKYHPTALVLNCQNHYFEEYTVGPDIIMEDAYPVGLNATFADKWGTACNLLRNLLTCVSAASSGITIPLEPFARRASRSHADTSAFTRKSRAVLQKERPTLKRVAAEMDLR